MGILTNLARSFASVDDMTLPDVPAMAASPKPVASPAPVMQEEAERLAYKAGVATVQREWGAAMKARGIAGNGERMVATMELMLRQPDISGADAASFVLTHISPPHAADAAGYEAMRMKAAEGAIMRTVREEP